MQLSLEDKKCLLVEMLASDDEDEMQENGLFYYNFLIIKTYLLITLILKVSSPY